MGNKGGLILLGLLLILSVLCQSGYSLQCYTCLRQGPECKTIANCTANHDACLHVIAETRDYFQCWKLANCNFDSLAKALGEKELRYNCCQESLCNRSDGMSITGSTVLLVTPLLAAFGSLFM